MFDETFRVCFADTPFGLELHQRIRYQVFCLDKGFENPRAFSKERETDAWDDRSAHFVVQNRQTGEWIAATRVVLPQARGGKLPVESLNDVKPPIALPEGAKVGEISRFCLINSKNIAVNPVNVALRDAMATWNIGVVPPDKRGEVILGMLRTVVIFGLKRRIDYYYLLITAPFARILRRIGVVLHQAGPPIEHRGKRTPYLIDLRESVVSGTSRSPEIKALFARARNAYVRISKVVEDPDVELVSEFSPDHSLFNETLFHETVLQPED